MRENTRQLIVTIRVGADHTCLFYFYFAHNDHLHIHTMRLISFDNRFLRNDHVIIVKVVFALLYIVEIMSPIIDIT
jgi:hypothetical protein